MPTYSLENNGPTRERHEHMTDDLTIGRLATLTGVSAKAIRYYEEIGCSHGRRAARIAAGATEQPI